MGGTCELGELVERADIEAISGWLRSADAVALAEARAWYAKGRSRTRRLYSWRSEFCRRLPAEQQRDLAWIEGMLAVALAGPASAAAWIPWRALSRYDTNVEAKEQQLLALIRSRGEKWCREFGAAAGAVRMGERELIVSAGVLYDVLSPLIVEMGLPVPSGSAFLYGWPAGRPWYPVDEAVARLARDPLMPDGFHHLLASGFTGKVKTAPELVPALVARGLVDRGRLFARIFELLTTQQPVGTQRVLAGLLTALQVRDDDIPGGLPTLQGVIATCHGSVGQVLLPFAVRQLSSVDDLVELCTTVAGRSERKQKKDLLRALIGELRGSLGDEAAVAGLSIFRESASEDPQLLASVDRALASLGVTTERSVAAPCARALWDLSPPGAPFVAPPLAQVSTKEQLNQGWWLLANRGVHQWRPDPGVNHYVIPELYLAGIVRLMRSADVNSVCDALVQLPSPNHTYPYPILEAVKDARRNLTRDAYLDAVGSAGVLRFDDSKRMRTLLPPYSLARYPDAFQYLLAWESLLRVGRTPCLLSTPTHGDATIEFCELVARVELCQGSGFGPLDLLQALLRVRPPAPGDLERLDGRVLARDPIVDVPDQPCTINDGVEAIRTWASAGGLPALQTEVDERGSWVPACEPPIPVSAFGASEGALTPQQTYPPGHGVVAPAWFELSLWGWEKALADPGNIGIREAGRSALHRSFPAGRVTHHLLLRGMVTNAASERADAGRAALELMGEGRFNPALFARCAAERLAAGVLPLARAAGVWDLMATAGGLRLLWPAVLRVAESAVALRPRPMGLADVFAWLSRYAHEVPEAELPPNLAAFAAERAATKAHHEARAFVDTMRTAVPA